MPEWIGELVKIALVIVIGIPVLLVGGFILLALLAFAPEVLIGGVVLLIIGAIVLGGIWIVYQVLQAIGGQGLLTGAVGLIALFVALILVALLARMFIGFLHVIKDAREAWKEQIKLSNDLTAKGKLGLKRRILGTWQIMKHRRAEREKTIKVARLESIMKERYGDESMKIEAYLEAKITHRTEEVTTLLLKSLTAYDLHVRSPITLLNAEAKSYVDRIQGVLNDERKGKLISSIPNDQWANTGIATLALIVLSVKPTIERLPTQREITVIDQYEKTQKEVSDGSYGGERGSTWEVVIQEEISHKEMVDEYAVIATYKPNDQAIEKVLHLQEYIQSAILTELPQEIGNNLMTRIMTPAHTLR